MKEIVALFSIKWFYIDYFTFVRRTADVDDVFFFSCFIVFNDLTTRSYVVLGFLFSKRILILTRCDVGITFALFLLLKVSKEPTILH